MSRIATPHSRRAISERCQPQEAPHHNYQQPQGDAPRDLAHFGAHRGAQSRPRSSDGDGEVDRLDEDEVEDRACDECRGEVRGEVVVQEFLARHEVEGEVVE